MALPIDQIREDLAHALKEKSPRILLKAPTGSGKSTRVPLFLLEEGWGESGTILIIQPRRIAARLLADYVARQRGQKAGGEVGYVVRFDHCTSSQTQVIYMTDGVLQRLLISDNLDLKGVSAVIFDEFHERSLAGDLCLARVMELQKTARPDLAVIVMSATMMVNSLKEYLGENCRVLEAGGRLYPVEIRYMPSRIASSRAGGADAGPPVWELAVEAVRDSLGREDCGDILVFMPGAYEIRRTVDELERKQWMKGREVYPLHGSMSPEQQSKALHTGPVPRVIVSTNVAETSLTIEGVRTVIDSGLARQSDWDARRGMNTLHVQKISRSSADQRTGRAGRLAPGYCIRLWSQSEHARRQEFDIPEVLRVDLSEALLVLKSWGMGDVRQFAWIDRPAEEALERSLGLLHSIEALDHDGSLSGTGREMLKYPLSPRLGRMLVTGVRHGCVHETAAVAALLQNESIAARAGLDAGFAEKDDYTDFQAEWRAVLKAERLRFDPRECNRFGVMARSARDIWGTYSQILNIALRGSRGRATDVLPDFAGKRAGVVRAMIKSFSDHVAVRNGIAANTCRLAGGKGGKLPSETVAYQGLFFTASEVSEVGGKGVETRVSRCTLIDLDELKECFPDDFSSEDVPVFDEARKRVINRRLTKFRELVMEDIDKGDAPPAQAGMILAAKIADGTLKLNEWDDAVEQWIRRLNAVAKGMPEMEIPAFLGEDRLVAYGVLCEGAVGYKEIKARKVMPVLLEWLSGWQRDAVDRYAPSHLVLSNGYKVKVRYEEDLVPVISLTAQRLFGVRETPCVMDGRQAVKIEILAPSQRPWQTTSSLESFWKNGYPAMRKELAGRYPRHKWPEAPHSL